MSREQFEKLPSIKPVISACTFDEEINEYKSTKLPDYSLGFVNGSWYTWQERQKTLIKLINQNKFEPIETWIVGDVVDAGKLLELLK